MVKMYNGQKGFTLIELLIVIAIMGVLAMVAVPRFMNMIGQSQLDACRANQGTLETALEQEVSLNGAYPASGNQSQLIASGILKRFIECPSEAVRGDSDDYSWTTAGVVSCAITGSGH